MKKLRLLLISSALLLASCSSKNEATKQKSETIEPSITTPITHSTQVSSSSKSETTRSESTTTESSSLATNSSDGSLTPKISSEKPTVTNEFPYAIDAERFNTPTTFQFKGANVPASVTLEKNVQTTVTIQPKSGGEATVYAASIETIPTTSIRIFSYAGNAIRTVKVNTKINLLNKLSSANTPDEYGPLYVLENSNGGLSLITPNYAGNISEGQSDVMLEAVH